MKEEIENGIIFIMFVSPAILASLLFDALGFGESICMLIFLIVFIITFKVSENLFRS